MKKNYRLFFACFIAFSVSIAANAQSVVVSGTIRNESSKEGLPAVSVVVKGTNQGTFTNSDGVFSISISKLPVVLVFSSIGYDNTEITVNDATAKVEVNLKPNSALGQEVVVSATRTATRILESPVTIDRMGTAAIRNVAAPNFYEAIANIKGVDMTTSSLTFRTISTRGFNGSGNLRFNQLMDGMDNQAPALNFSVGNIVGMSELDADNAELLSGASSALYGSGGMNGTLLLTSKNPFKYQGFSMNIKQGIMHINDVERKASPYYDWSMRWGKKVSEKFAFKIAGSFSRASDWVANDTRNLNRNNVISSIKAGNRTSDPNYDGVNVFGDEANALMSGIAQAGIFGPSNTSLPGVISAIAMQCSCTPSTTQILQFYGGLTPSPSNPLPILANGLLQNTFGGQSVSRTGYNEKFLVDYGAYSLKTTGGLYYKLTNDIEASLVGYWGMGTTVYTGADRYSLQNFKIGQYKAELKSKNWFLRAYTTQENSGDSYTATTAALNINRQWKSDETWFGTYTATYGASRLGGLSDANAHASARAAADAGRFLPGTVQFDNALIKAKTSTIKNGGSKFADKSDLWHYEGQANLSDKIKFVETLVGATFRTYSINSGGTIFADTTGPIKINEYGAYLQLQKQLLNGVLKLTGSIRYDKRESYEGRFTPRITALVKVAKDNNIRFSYQTAYRFPSIQDQWINLNTPGTRLIGGDKSFINFFKFNTNPVYTSESVALYRSTVFAGAPNPTLLKQATFITAKPENVHSFELGYKGLIAKKLLIDIYGYRSKYKDFIARVAVARGRSGNPATFATELASSFTSENFSFQYNTTTPVTAYGLGMGFEYLMRRGFVVSGNLTTDRLRDLPSGIISFFNTPKYRFNIGLANEKLCKTIGFALVYRWQDKIDWEGTFGAGPVSSYGTLDAQVTHKVPQSKGSFKIGASNLLNKYYSSAFGNPQVGGVYYVSYGYNL